MITVKLCSVGGYVMGDGDLPAGFNADTFLKHAIKKMVAKGLTEMSLSDEDLVEATKKMEGVVNSAVDEADTLQYDNTTVAAEELTALLDSVMEAQND